MKKYFGLASALFLFSLLGGCGHRHNQTVDTVNEVKINFSVGSAKALGLTIFTPGLALSVSDYQMVITCYGATADGTIYPLDGLGAASQFSYSQASPSALLIPASLTQCTSSLLSVTITDGSNPQTWNSSVSGNFTSDPDYFVAFGSSNGSQLNFRLSSPSPMGGSASHPWSLTYEFAFTQPVQVTTPSSVNAGSVNHSISIVNAIEPLPSIASLTNLGVNLDATNGISILSLDDSGNNSLFVGSNLAPCGGDAFFVYADTPNSSGFAPVPPVTPYLARNAATQTSRAVTSSSGINSIVIPNTASVARSILSKCGDGSYDIFAAVGCANTSGLASYYWVDIPFTLTGSSASIGVGICPI